MRLPDLRKKARQETGWFSERMARYAQEEEDELEPDELAENRIRSGCIGEEFLSAEVEKTGKHQDCAYREKSGKTISIGELADRDWETAERWVLWSTGSGASAAGG
jgi:hypothetical protein